MTPKDEQKTERECADVCLYSSLKQSDQEDTELNPHSEVSPQLIVMMAIMAMMLMMLFCKSMVTVGEYLHFRFSLSVLVHWTVHHSTCPCTVHSSTRR